MNHGTDAYLAPANAPGHMKFHGYEMVWDVRATRDGYRWKAGNYFPEVRVMTFGHVGYDPEFDTYSGLTNDGEFVAASTLYEAVRQMLDAKTICYMDY